MVTPEELAQDFYYENGKVLRKTTRSRWKAGTRAGYKEKRDTEELSLKTVLQSQNHALFGVYAQANGQKEK